MTTTRSATLSIGLALGALLAGGGCASGPAPTECPPPAAAPQPERPARATQPSRFDARLSGYDYPFDVEMFELSPQRGVLQMAYMDTGRPGDGRPVVVLMHGKNFSGTHWARTARDLTRQGLRVIIPDQIGFGKSSKPPRFQYSFHSLAHATLALLDHLQVAQFSLVGHSMGGMLAARTALLYPDRVQKLVLVNPIGLEDWQQVVPYQPVDAWEKAELQKTPKVVRDYMKASYFDGVWRPEYDALSELQEGWSQSPDRRVLAWTSARVYDMIFTQPVVHDLGRLRAPTLLIIGTRDRTAIGKALVSESVRATLGRYDILGRRAAAAIPQAKLVELEGVGHIPQVEAYEPYMQAMRVFLKP